MTTTTATKNLHGAAVATPVWAALARREARFVLRHPLILIGIVASAAVLWTFNRDQLPHLAASSTYVGMGLAPLAGASLLVGHLIASRAQRHQTLEIESSAPAIQRTRTAGRLIGSLAVTPVAALLVAAYMAYQYQLGAAGQPDLGELLVAPAIVGLASVAGVAAGTWFPGRFSGLLAFGSFAAVQIKLQDAESTRHWFAWWHSVLWHGSPDLWTRPTWAHLGYVVGFTLIVAAFATLRHGLRPVALALLVGGGILTIAAGAVQAQPPTAADVDSVFEQITNPALYWTTIERGDVTYEVLPSYDRWVEWWDAAIQPVLAPIPTDDRPSLVVEQWHHSFPSQLEEEFGYSTPEGQAISERGGELHFGSRYTDPWPIRLSGTAYIWSQDSLAVAAAHRAAGLPLVYVETEGRLYTDDEIAQFGQSAVTVTEDDGGGASIDSEDGPWWPDKELGAPQPVAGDRIPLQLACNAEGQAREVLAAWLAARADPDIADVYRRIRADGPNAPGLDEFTNVIGGYDVGEGAIQAVQWRTLGWIWAAGPGEGGSVNAVLGSPTATDLAAQLLDLPEGHVASALAEHWQSWTDPATSIQAIIDEFGLEPPPTPEQWLLRAGDDIDPADYAESIAAYPLWIGDDKLIDQPYPTCR